MANQKLSKFGIFLASVAVMGATQVLPVNVPVLGTQVVKAEENEVFVTVVSGPYNLDTERMLVSSYDDVPVYRLKAGESLTITAPVIEGYTYEKYIMEEVIGKTIQEGAENTLTFNHPESFKGKATYNVLWGYRPSASQADSNTSTPDQPADTGNTGETSTTDTPTDTSTGATETDPTTDGKTDVVDKGTTTPDKPSTGTTETPTTGEVDKETETPSQPVDTIKGEHVYFFEPHYSDKNWDFVAVSLSMGIFDSPNHEAMIKKAISNEERGYVFSHYTLTTDDIFDGYIYHHIGVYYKKIEDPTDTPATGEADKETGTPSQPVDTDTKPDTGATESPNTTTPDTGKDAEEKPTVTPETPSTDEAGKETDTEQAVDTTDKEMDSSSQEPPVLVGDKLDLGKNHVEVEEKPAEAEKMPVTPVTSVQPVAKSQTLSRVESRHLPETGDSSSLLATLLGLTGLSLGLLDRRRYKK